MKSFDVALNYNQEDEAVTKFPVDSQIGIEDKHLRIYQLMSLLLLTAYIFNILTAAEIRYIGLRARIQPIKVNFRHLMYFQL